MELCGQSNTKWGRLEPALVSALLLQLFSSGPDLHIPRSSQRFCTSAMLALLGRPALGFSPVHPSLLTGAHSGLPILRCEH